jgi:hypothetical protein
MPRIVTYRFELPDGQSWDFSVDVDRAHAAAAPQSAAPEPPEWTRLDFHRCPKCPLAGTCGRCPVALDVAPIIEKFSALQSIVRMRVQVVLPERTCIADTDAQLGLKALLGLVMASSACPVLAQLRSQALFHLPFASVDETLYRAVGDYLIKQYFVMKDGGAPDFALKGLDTLYLDLAELNTAFFKRLQLASPKDAIINAIVTLRSMSDIVSMSLDDRLSPLRDAMR